MLRKNTRHQQISLTSHVECFPLCANDYFNSRAETFYREFFCYLDEEAFAVLKTDEPSRPNVLVNVMASQEFLKAASGSDV